MRMRAGMVNFWFQERISWAIGICYEKSHLGSILELDKVDLKGMH